MPAIFLGSTAPNTKPIFLCSSLSRVVIVVLLLLPIQLIAQKKISANVQADKPGSTLSRVFKKYSLYAIDTRDIAAYAREQKGSYTDLDVELQGHAALALKLLPHDIISPDYTLHVGTANGVQVIDRPDVITYSGRLADDDASSVYLTISNDLIYGFIRGNGKKYFIEPLRYFDKQAAANLYVFYEAQDVIPYSGIACAVSELQQRTLPTEAPPATEGTAVGTCLMVRIAIASDDSMFLRYGSAQAVAEHNIAAVNIMVGTYGNAQLTGPRYLEFRIKGQYVSTAPAANPYQPLYTAPIADAGLMLGAFRTWGQAGKFNFTDYDMAQVWTTRNIAQESPAGSGNYAYSVIGLAYVGATCTSSKYQLLEDAGLSGEQLGSLITHETGHNLGASHDASGSTWVMAPSIGNPPNVVFSPASITAMSTHISGGGGACLLPCNATLPNAAFNSSVKGICTGSSVIFTDYSSGQVTSRSWSFPDGSPATSTAAAETVTYSTPGVKSVTLTVTNASGTNTITKSIVVANAPVAACRTNTAGSGQQGGFTNFKLADINFTTNIFYLGGRYEDHTCTNNTRLNPATTYNGTVQLGFQQLPTYNIFSQLEVFIDYNNDGDFLDAGEGVYFSTNCAQGNVSFSFTTPPSVPVTNNWLRLRVIGRSCDLPATNGCSIPNNSHIRDFAVSFSAAQPCITYVNAAATGLNNGTSWANAYTDLQTALAGITPCENNQVWVAAGTYKPTTTTNRSISFAMKDKVGMYGGFPNTGNPGFAERNPVVYETILSGDIGEATNTDNSHHVIKNNAALDNSATLDGFIITAGYAGGVGIEGFGGGMLNDPPVGDIVPVIRNCIFRNNTSLQAGGAVYNDATGPSATASPTFINCVFQSNTSINNGGGAIGNENNISFSAPVFINCSFTGNTAALGSVIRNIGGSGSKATLQNCIVFGNPGSLSFSNGSGSFVPASNTLFETGFSGYTNGTGSIISPVSPFAALGNVQLSDTSAAINAGSSTNAPGTDISGAGRLAMPDMGAFENKQTCFGGDKNYYSNISGTAYQWQRDDGSGYADISNNALYKNATSPVLSIVAAPKTSTGEKYRCRVTTGGGPVYSNEFTVRFYNYWLGTVDNNWQNIQNWSCGEVPDQYTDVIVKGAKNNYPSLNVTGAVRQLMVENGSSITLTNSNNLQIMGK